MWRVEHVGRADGSACTQNSYARVSYAFVPLLLLALTPIPCVGDLLALVAVIWALIVYVLAIARRHPLRHTARLRQRCRPCPDCSSDRRPARRCGVFSILSVLM